MLSSIITTDTLLVAHMAQINGDPMGLGMNFVAAATHLMLADPVERSKVKRKRLRNNNPSISSVLAGRGETGVDFRWYNRDEFKGLDQDQKDELAAWRATAVDKAAMESTKAKFKAKRDAKKQEARRWRRKRWWCRRQGQGSGYFQQKQIAEEIPSGCCKGFKEDVYCLD